MDTPPEPDHSHDETRLWDRARARMVKDQLLGPGRDIRDTRVIAAMRTVPRHAFVPEAERPRAYDDQPRPIGYGQTISQPYIVALMTELLEPHPSDRVLEVGTGSGYQTAILAQLVAQIYTIEVIPALAHRARLTFAELGYSNIHVRVGDGSMGWPEEAPFDGILVTCAPEQVPAPLLEQLSQGGRLIIPVGDARGQHLYRWIRRHGGLEQDRIIPVRFVPLIHPSSPPTDTTDG
jgi:protein-L-isoaspartate(D-aspartate) O-methyltransferase